jgi:lauroyl/myristoyl acyltransferase
MQLLGKIYYLFRRTERRLIERNIRDMLQDTPKPLVAQIIRQTFRGIFDHYFEKMFSAFHNVDRIERYMKRRVSVQNTEYLDKALSKGKGGLLVTAHWGAAEFIPWVLGLAGYPISVILECKTEHLEAALCERAKTMDVELLTCGENSPIFCRALKSLQRNRLLMTECDEVDAWHKRESRTINLFGKCLYLDNTLDILAKRSGASVVGVFLKRISRFRYTLICEPIGSENNTAVEAFELWQKYVTLYPEQWFQWRKWQAMKVAS